MSDADRTRKGNDFLSCWQLLIAREQELDLSPGPHRAKPTSSTNALLLYGLAACHPDALDGPSIDPLNAEIRQNIVYKWLIRQQNYKTAKAALNIARKRLGKKRTRLDEYRSDIRFDASIVFFLGAVHKAEAEEWTPKPLNKKDLKLARTSIGNLLRLTERKVVMQNFVDSAEISRLLKRWAEELDVPKRSYSDSSARERTLIMGLARALLGIAGLRKRDVVKVSHEISLLAGYTPKQWTIERYVTAASRERSERSRLTQK